MWVLLTVILFTLLICTRYWDWKTWNEIWWLVHVSSRLDYVERKTLTHMNNQWVAVQRPWIVEFCSRKTFTGYRKGDTSQPDTDHTQLHYPCDTLTDKGALLRCVDVLQNVDGEPGECNNRAIWLAVVCSGVDSQFARCEYTLVMNHITNKIAVQCVRDFEWQVGRWHCLSVSDNHVKPVHFRNSQCSSIELIFCLAQSCTWLTCLFTRIPNFFPARYFLPSGISSIVD